MRTILLLLCCTLVGNLSAQSIHDVTTASLKPRGQFVTREFPDTLDLAERAEAAIHCMVNIIEPKQDYYSWCNIKFGEEVSLSPLSWNLPCEYIFSLPLARTMCGSEEGLDVELGTMRSYLNGLAEDGVVYSPREDLGKPKGSCFPDNIGFVSFALANWYERDGNRLWLDKLGKLAGGFDKMAIRREDRAFYPPEHCYMPDGRWLPEARGPVEPFNGEEPGSDQEGFEGSVKYYHAAPLQGLVKYHKYTGDTKSLELARALAQFMLKPQLWQDTTAQGYNGVERGIFGGHFHGNLIPLWALLNLGVATEDQKLLRLVRSGYEHARRYVVPGLGWSPCYMYPSDFGTYHKHPFCDGCNTADTIALAVKLSSLGLGDYWDDAEACLRNQLAQSQLIDLEPMRKRLVNTPNGEQYLQRFRGGFFQTEPGSVYTREEAHMPGCCIGSGPWGLYFGWLGITEFSEGVATVNMFLNRVAPWVEVASWVPHEGRVEIRNKQAHTILVRIPGWLMGEEIRASMDGKPVKPALQDGRMTFADVKPGAVIRLDFTLRDEKQHVHIEGTEFELTLRGGTVLDISPRPTEPGVVMLYNDPAAAAKKVKMVEKKYFVAEKLLPLP